MLPALALFLALQAGSPVPDLAKRAAAREAESEAERANYAYRQTVIIEEMDSRGAKAGEYREVRDIIFSPEKERTEKLIGKPRETLVRLRLTEEDFRDIREVQPLLITSERLFLYQTRYRGEETIDGIDCWLLEVRPRQTLEGQRLFDGLIWVAKSDYSIVRTDGKAVPQILSTKSENLFPSFTTFRRKMSSGHWFPVETLADDVLPFRTGPLRIRMKILYSDYRRFGSESIIRFEEPRR
ncbi:MAG: hypothetical protein ACRD8O_10030 [Bryobacteraceae bacterium]